MGERWTYRRAGVDVDAARRAVELMKPLAGRARRAEVLGGLGGFGGLFALGRDRYRDPVLVAGADGVGTKLKLAFALGRHDTVGVDCVAMNVNDILTAGAEPLFFLDYLAVGRLDPEQVAAVVAGVARGCEEAGCALLGGETAEMPGFYAPGEYDLAGFAVGVVERDAILGPERARAGDALLGLAASGLHANGFSLVRRLLAEARVNLDHEPPELGRTVGEELLQPTRIYVRPVLEVLRREGAAVRALAHVTGGGFPENVPRALPPGLAARLRSGSWPEPPVYAFLRRLAARHGGIEEEELRRTFNLGLGMVMVAAPEAADGIARLLAAEGVPCWVVGEVVAGEGVIFT